MPDGVLFFYAEIVAFYLYLLYNKNINIREKSAW